MTDAYRQRLSGLVSTGNPAGSRTSPRRPSPLPALPEGVEKMTPHGVFYLMEMSLSDFVAAEGERFPVIPKEPWTVEEKGGVQTRIRQPVFFDLETTGFSSSPLFLAGTLTLDDGEPVLRQRFARDYSEEEAVIFDTLEEIGTGGSLVSFNGKSYDIPFLRARAARHRIPFSHDIPHIDLLHQARRVWKGRFPDFKLQTLERMFTSGERTGDIPGGDIPDLYHGYVRRGYEPLLRNVFRHNLRDIVTLVRLLFLLTKESGKSRRRIRR